MIFIDLMDPLLKYIPFSDYSSLSHKDHLKNNQLVRHFIAHSNVILI